MGAFGALGYLHGEILRGEVKGSHRNIGAQLGHRWVRMVASQYEIRNLLNALDQLVDAGECDYRSVYAELVPVRSLTEAGTTRQARIEQAKAPSDQWWSQTAGAFWPEDELDRNTLAQAFVLGAAMEIRRKLLNLMSSSRKPS